MKSLPTLAAALLMSAGPVAAEDLETILDRYVEAKGGAQAWSEVESASMTGTMLMGHGMEAPFRMEFKQPQKIRLEFDVQGMTGVQAFDGEKGWMIMPFMGKTTPEAMAEEDLKQIRENADFDGPLMGWEAAGHQLRYEGMDDVEGTPVHKLVVQRADGDEQLVYLDADSYLELKTTTRTTRNGQEMVVHTMIGDYKDVDGLMMPHVMEMTFEGMPVSQTIVIEAGQLNVEIDDERFAMPVVATSSEAEQAE